MKEFIVYSLRDNKPIRILINNVKYDGISINLCCTIEKDGEYLYENIDTHVKYLFSREKGRVVRILIGLPDRESIDITSNQKLIDYLYIKSKANEYCNIFEFTTHYRVNYID